MVEDLYKFIATSKTYQDYFSLDINEVEDLLHDLNKINQLEREIDLLELDCRSLKDDAEFYRDEMKEVNVLLENIEDKNNKLEDLLEHTEQELQLHINKRKARLSNSECCGCDDETCIADHGLSILYQEELDDALKTINLMERICQGLHGTSLKEEIEHNEAFWI